MIDPRAIIDPCARLGANVSVGPWTIIGPNVEIGEDCEIGSHVILKGPTRMGRGNRIYQFATIGDDTPALAYLGEETFLEIGDDNVFREGVTVHRGTVQDEGRTVIGSSCLFMAYVHVAHDCVVGDQVIMANNAALSGHVHVGDHANFGGYVTVAQYRHVGAQTHIAALSMVNKDIPDFMTVAGNPAAAIGLNLEGMRRRNLDKSVIQALKQAHRAVYRQGLTVDDAVAQLAEAAVTVPEVAAFVSSVQNSRWGIVRTRAKAASSE